MPIVPVQCFFRTFKITGGGYSATCFVINRHDRQWLITAKHFLEDAAPTGAGSMHILSHEGEVDLQFKPEFVPLTQPGADIAVFSLGDQKLARDDLTLVASADGVILSQDVYFLGYPLPAASRSAARYRSPSTASSQRVPRSTVSGFGTSMATTTPASQAAL